MVDVIRQHIEIVEGPDGSRAHIAGSRIRVMDIAIWHRMGMSADDIANEFPTISLADVHAALAYYWDNREAIEAAMEEERAYVEDARRRIASPLLEKLHRLRDS